jgi:hypothetical protein
MHLRVAPHRVCRIGSWKGPAKSLNRGVRIFNMTLTLRGSGHKCFPNKEAKSMCDELPPVNENVWRTYKMLSNLP